MSNKREPECVHRRRGINVPLALSCPAPPLLPLGTIKCRTTRRTTVYVIISRAEADEPHTWGATKLLGHRHLLVLQRCERHLIGDLRETVSASLINVYQDAVALALCPKTTGGGPAVYYRNEALW